MRSQEGSKGDAAHYLALAAIMAFALSVRLINISQEPLWTDEGLTLIIAQWSLFDLVIRPADENPFLYYLLHKLFLTPYDSAAAIRSISVVTGMLAVLVMYGVGRLSLGRNAGLLAAALLSVWTIHVDYSQEARAYSLLFLLTSLSSLALLWWFQNAREAEARRQRVAALILYTLSASATLYAHNIAIFWIPASALVPAFFASRVPQQARREAFLALLALGILILPGVARIGYQMTHPNAFDWLGQASVWTFLQVAATAFLPSGWWDNPLVETYPSLDRPEWFALLAWIAVAILLFWRRAELARFAKSRPMPFALMLAFCALPVVIWLFGFVVKPIFMERTILFAVPGFILVIAAIVHTMKSKFRSRAAGAAALGAYALATALHGTVREKQDWPAVHAFLQANAAPGDLIVICPEFQHPAYRHAVRSPAAAPVAILRKRGLTVLEDPVGSRRDWARGYFFRVPAGPDTDPTHLLTLPDARAAIAPGGSLWLVSATCAPDMRKQIEAAARLSLPPQRAWRNADPDFAAEILRYR